MYFEIFRERLLKYYVFVLSDNKIWQEAHKKVSSISTRKCLVRHWIYIVVKTLRPGLGLAPQTQGEIISYWKLLFYPLLLQNWLNLRLCFKIKYSSLYIEYLLLLES